MITRTQTSTLFPYTTLFRSKKALIYFSSGISKSGFDNQAQLTAATNAAKKANVNIYPIDARGLVASAPRSEEHTSELQSRQYLVCRLLLEKKKKQQERHAIS